MAFSNYKFPEIYLSFDRNFAEASWSKSNHAYNVNTTTAITPVKFHNDDMIEIIFKWESFLFMPYFYHNKIFMICSKSLSKMYLT